MSLATRARDFSLLATLSIAGCYRAEIALSVFDGDAAAAGSAGAAAPGGSSGTDGRSAGSGGMPDGAGESTSGAGGICVDTVDDVQLSCRLHLPSQTECSAQDPDGFNGCSQGGCIVCDDVTSAYPYYFKWHPCCQPNSGCATSQRVKCNARCPAPGPRDKIAPCWLAPTSD